MKFYDWILDVIPKIKWHKQRFFFVGYEHKLKHNNIAFAKLCKMFNDEQIKNAIILTSDGAALSSWGVKLLNFIFTGNAGQYSHAALKLGNVCIEAVNSGVRYASFDEITKADNFCMLVPKNDIEMKLEQRSLGNWELDVIGKNYDKKFKLFDRKNMSCIEVVYDSLRWNDELDKMPNFVALINKKKNLTPQMLRECKDFKAIYEFNKGKLL